MLAGLQVLLVVRTGAGEQACVDLVDVVTAAHHGAELLAILGEGDGAALGQFEALPHALHAHVDIAAVGKAVRVLAACTQACCQRSVAASS
jgi:hypothetical protein